MASGKRLFILLLCALAVFAGIYTYVRIKNRNPYPGQFVYSDYNNLLFTDSHQARQPLTYIDKTSPSGFAPDYIMRHEKLTLSPAGERIAYVKRNGNQITHLLIETTGKDSVVRIQRRIDLQKYNIPEGYRSNLAWNPESSQIAYAAENKLYVIDMKSRQVTSVDLPHNDGLTAITKAWNLYIKQTGDTIDNHNRPKPEDSSEQFSNAARKMIRSSALRMQNDLRISSKTPVYEAPSWYYLREKDDSKAGQPQHYLKQFKYSGRNIEWSSKNVLFCDNWRLTLDQSGSKLAIQKAVKLPVPSEYFSRPVWNRQGTRAAYTLVVRGLKSKGIKYPGLLVIVDAEGNVLKRQVTPLSQLPPRWARDGKYIALLCPYSSKDDLDAIFSIYNTATWQHWQVDVGRPAGLTDTAYELRSAWDWRY